MAKRPQGLHKAALAKKKQKLSKEDTGSSAASTPKAETSPSEPENALEFDADIDPNDELASLYAMFDSVVNPRSAQQQQLSDGKLYSMIIHTCDNILRMHSKKNEKNDQKEEDEEEEKEKEKETKEENGEVDPIDLLPEVLPDKFHNIYARALLNMGKLMQEEQEEDDEDEDEFDDDEDDEDAEDAEDVDEDAKDNEDTSSSVEKKEKALHDTPADFFEAALERVATGLETHPTSSDLLFTRSRANVAKVADHLKRDTLEVFGNLDSHLFDPINFALKDFEAAEEAAEKKAAADAATYSDFELGAIETLLEIGDHIGVSLPLALSLLEDQEEEDGEKKKKHKHKSKKNKKKNIKITKKDLQSLSSIEEQYLTWSKDRYETMLKGLENPAPKVVDKKGKGKSKATAESGVLTQTLAHKAHRGLGKYYTAKASPHLDEYEEIVIELPENEKDVDAAVLQRLEVVRAQAKELMEQAVSHFVAAEPADATESENDWENEWRGDVFALAAEAQISLANLLAEEEEQEKLYKEAVRRLRWAQRLGSGDFSEQIRDLLP
ncbi:uncharacterized protein SAPINGB_P005015 [Magnusiomyces paraingens]|uniref:Enhancer of translation termination 1 n=1 Tax=Magnusiomyces paraingens TaxID=2606893 RepID=A0A5E8C322_9ASCO|nr:uncharacterized protein SAPINGB_P005015 [Saprochaete ingens]VVT56371.1 unnamed protein product [Saprochaete ingens]